MNREMDIEKLKEGLNKNIIYEIYCGDVKIIIIYRIERCIAKKPKEELNREIRGENILLDGEK